MLPNKRLGLKIMLAAINYLFICQNYRRIWIIWTFFIHANVSLSRTIFANKIIMIIWGGTLGWNKSYFLN